MNIAATPTSITDRPQHLGEWPIDRIIESLKVKFPTLEKQRKQGGASLTYLPWVHVVKVLDRYAIGWKWEIRQITTTDDRLFMVGRLTIPALEGEIWREATGNEALKEVSRKTGEIQDIAYGDPSSNAESQSFRRAAAKFGLGLYLYK